MTTAWTLTASEVCTDALRHLGVLGSGDAASADDLQSALRGLDTVLKELPLAGYTWPKLSGEVAVAWPALTLPTDYYGYPVMWRTENGAKTPLTQIPHATWVGMTDRTAAGICTHFYISPANVLSVWPVPTTDPGLYLQYLRIVDDASLAVTPDVLQSMKGALAYGVADEISLTFSAPKDVRAEIHQRWMGKRQLMLANSIPYEAISFTVAD